jgi:NADP-dependent aldehyde dehydrogenase
MELIGKSIIGFRSGAAHGETSYGVNPATGERLMPVYHLASLAEVDEAAQLAHRAFAVYGRLPGKVKAAFLRKIAKNIEALGDHLVTRANQETGLPTARIQAETARTCNQLRLFADLVEEGSWVDARIDRAIPDRQPVPKPDLRSLMRPLGPVVVFCASNFPIAFSVAGGDTASALAAGCPVIVKAHHAHPGTAEMVGLAVRDAVRECEMPEGVFSLLYGAGSQIGMALIKHPLVKAGGFTGSRTGGRSLFDAASSRPEPIPFYAEMSSINPVFILPRAARERRDQVAAGLHGSVTLGAGQFCTNPGLVLMADDADTDAFVEKLSALMANTPEFTMLTPGIGSAYREGVSSRVQHPQVKTVALKEVEPGPGRSQSGTALFKTDAPSFLAHPELSEEVFGASTLIVTHSNREEMLEVARTLEGQLTATIHGTEDDLKEHSDLIAILETRVGRLVFNGFPTGIEVCHSIVHSGPYPATSDGRSTSVGTRAIYRFVRAICFQNFPNSALPDELKNENPLGLWRMVDGRWTREPV